MNYENIIKELRKRLQLSQEEVAAILDIDRTTYNHYENSYITIPLKHLNTIANYFKVSLDYIFGFNLVASYDDTNEEINNIYAGQRLKEFRKENKITQDKLAEVLNTNRSVIANYERGRTIISAPFLYTICKKYNVSADYLLGKIDYKPTLEHK